jgi:hypothetical protein
LLKRITDAGFAIDGSKHCDHSHIDQLFVAINASGAIEAAAARRAESLPAVRELRARTTPARARARARARGGGGAASPAGRKRRTRSGREFDVGRKMCL